MPPHGNDAMRRHEKVNAFCEAIRALDATGLLLIWINLCDLVILNVLSLSISIF